MVLRQWTTTLQGSSDPRRGETRETSRECLSAPATAHSPPLIGTQTPPFPFGFHPTPRVALYARTTACAFFSHMRRAGGPAQRIVNRFTYTHTIVHRPMTCLCFAHVVFQQTRQSILPLSSVVFFYTRFVYWIFICLYPLFVGGALERREVCRRIKVSPFMLLSCLRPLCPQRGERSLPVSDLMRDRGSVSFPYDGR